MIPATDTYPRKEVYHYAVYTDISGRIQQSQRRKKAGFFVACGQLFHRIFRFYSLFSSLPFHCRHMARDVIFPDGRSVFRFSDRLFLLPCLPRLQSFRLRILPKRKAPLHPHTAGSFHASRLFSDKYHAADIFMPAPFRYYIFYPVHLSR